jgi:hypothetical protein
MSARAPTADLGMRGKPPLRTRGAHDTVSPTHAKLVPYGWNFRFAATFAGDRFMLPLSFPSAGMANRATAMIAFRYIMVLPPFPERTRAMVSTSV